MGRTKKLTLSERWAGLPSVVRALPYIFVAGGLSEVVKTLSDLEVNDVALMGGMNLLLLLLKKGIDKLREKVGK